MEEKAHLFWIPSLYRFWIPIPNPLSVNYRLLHIIKKNNSSPKMYPIQRLTYKHPLF